MTAAPAAPAITLPNDLAWAELWPRDLPNQTRCTLCNRSWPVFKADLNKGLPNTYRTLHEHRPVCPKKGRGK